MATQTANTNQAASTTSSKNKDVKDMSMLQIAKAIGGSAFRTVYNVTRTAEDVSEGGRDVANVVIKSTKAIAYASTAFAIENLQLTEEQKDLPEAEKHAILKAKQKAAKALVNAADDDEL